MALSTQRLAGSVSRALPRFHGPIERWLARHPGEHEVSYRDVDGLLRTADLRDHLERAWFSGVPCGLPRDVLARVPADTLAIDVGANVGTVTGQLARRAGRVWAIEPVPRNVARLTELVEQNDLAVDVVPVAVGAVDGSVELRLADQSGWASVTTSWIDAERLIVPLRSLDSLMAARAPRWPLSFIKIDVQAYEPEVLAGARETLDRWRPLLYVEFADPDLRDRGSSSAQLLAMCADLGYAPVGRTPVLEGLVTDLLLEATKSRRETLVDAGLLGRPKRLVAVAPGDNPTVDPAADDG